jgi:lactoylglutathione lyase
MHRIDYVILYVSDLSASVRFYRDVLGLPFKFEDRGYAEFSTGGARFGLFDRRLLPDLIGSASEQAPGGPSGEVLILVDDVDTEYDRLSSAGARILSGPVDRPWGHRTLHLADLDGNVVEIAQEIPRAVPRSDRPA